MTGLLSFYLEKDVTDLYQGDIKKMADAVNEKRNAVNDKTKLWIGKVVPYTIDSQFAGKLQDIHLAEFNKRCVEVEGRLGSITPLKKRSIACNVDNF